MKFLHILVLAAASASAFSLDPRHHGGKKGGKASKNNSTARSIETQEQLHVERSAPVALDLGARDVSGIEARHHGGKTKANKANKANKSGNAAANATARAVDTEARSSPANLDLETRDVNEIVVRHHGGKTKANKAGKASKNGNAAANATARGVDTERQAAPVDLTLEARDMSDIAARHHGGKTKASKANKANKNSGNAAANATARAIDTEARSSAVDLDLEARDDMNEVVARHHGGKTKANKAGKASKNANAAANATARGVDTESQPRSAPVHLDLEARDGTSEIEARHHGGKTKAGKASKANKNNGNAAANATARAVDIEGKAPVDLIGRAFVA